ncbi:MAG: hypothetical protein AAFW69_03695, partial [Pseudomonadota bacterium]
MFDRGDSAKAIGTEHVAEFGIGLFRLSGDGAHLVWLTPAPEGFGPDALPGTLRDRAARSAWIAGARGGDRARFLRTATGPGGALLWFEEHLRCVEDRRERWFRGML